MFDKKQKKLCKMYYLVADDGLYDRNVFYKVKLVFIHPLGQFYFEITKLSCLYRTSLVSPALG